MPVIHSAIEYVSGFFIRGDDRTLRAKKNIGVAFLTKGLSVLLSFIIVPLTLNYVGKEEYGIWMIISSIIAWFNFFDIGLGNGLRNKLAESLALDQVDTARVYISSTFVLITLISLLMFLCFSVVSCFISWDAVVNTSIVTNMELRRIVIVVFFFFCIDFILKTVASVLQAMQRYAIYDIIKLLAQFLGLIAIFILTHTTRNSLFLLCIVYGGQSAVVMLIATVILFQGSLKRFRPSLKFVRLKQAMPLLNLGMRFFFVQIFYMIISQTSFILVAQFFGPQDVTVFNLGVRYISIMPMIYIMVLTPFLSAFTEAYTKKEFNCIRNTISRINLIWALCSIGTGLLVLASRIFFKLWVGNAITVPLILIIALAVSSVINTWGATFSIFLNGIGKIRIQLYFLGTQAILIFPLTYLFYKLNFGLISIVLVQVLFYSVDAFIYTFQYKSIISQRAEGIWNR